MTSTVLGIDISKRDFHVSLLKEGRATKPKKFTNNVQGFESLHNWLQQQSVVELHVCMEATSNWVEALADGPSMGLVFRLVSCSAFKGG